MSLRCSSIFWSSAMKGSGRASGFPRKFISGFLMETVVFGSTLPVRNALPRLSRVEYMTARSQRSWSLSSSRVSTSRTGAT